jgi:hypothetical protein
LEDPNVQRTSDCGAWYTWLIQRYFKRTPLAGCTDACEGGGTGCCANVSVVTSLNPSPLFNIDTDNMITLANTSGTLPDSTLEVVQYMNVLLRCRVRTCTLGTSPTAPQCNSAAQATANNVFPSFCGGVGECLASTPTNDTPQVLQCSCPEGYTGAYCQSTSAGTGCPTVWNNTLKELLECGGEARGTCVNNECVCNDDWTGPGCAQQQCTSVNGLVCSGHGTCTTLGICTCDAQWFGNACQCTATSTGATTCLTGGSAAVPTVNGDGAVSFNGVDISSNLNAEREATVRRFTWVMVGAGILFLVVIGLFIGAGVTSHKASQREADAKKWNVPVRPSENEERIEALKRVVNTKM